MRYLILSSLIFLSVSAFAQSEKYWVFFTDKDGVEFNPYTYFSEKAIERRVKLEIDLD